MRHFEEPPGAVVEDGWKTVSAVGLPSTPFRLLQDGALVMLGVPFVYPDDELYVQSVSWLPKSGKTLPRRIWVFPDEAVSPFMTTKDVEHATKHVGRWVRAGKKRAPYEELGFTAAERRDWLKEAMSGDPIRVKAAREDFERRLAGRSEEELNALLKSVLKLK